MCPGFYLTYLLMREIATYCKPVQKRSQSNMFMVR